MAEHRLFKTLRSRSIFWSLGSLATGIAATWLWMSSQAEWHAHLHRAYQTGLVLYETLRQETKPPPGIVIEHVALKMGSETETQALPDFPDLPTPMRVTSMSIIANQTGTMTGTRLQLHIVSKNLNYPVAYLTPGSDRLPAERMGDLTRLMASYCSEPLLFARFDQGGWVRVDGTEIWGCGAAPSDKRLIALVILIVGLVLILTQVAETAAQFGGLANALKLRQRFLGKPELEETGPEELREIVRTLNEYLLFEQDRLEKRALLLSGVSHDLGTPATRLRLRTALIEDEELRTKLEADIDQMTGMIESVLTYTRSELNSEEPRRVSLTSLVESIVADYQDIGKPVLFRASQVTAIEKGRSVFGGGGGNLLLPHEDARRILVTARPISLQRAITNLIDNSLKYGRRATVSLEADSETASIIVEDEGTSISEGTLNTLTGPFLRGENANFVEGVGLGLTIVSTIARQHGGTVTFEPLSTGLKAVLKISRQ
ncbi:MAG: sensor histidine kinase [Rhodobacteraceae bacterium]|nr:sensor histidine kinase [Paracoccaceae bacterium]